MKYIIKRMQRFSCGPAGWRKWYAVQQVEENDIETLSNSRFTFYVIHTKLQEIHDLLEGLTIWCKEAEFCELEFHGVGCTE